MSSFLWNPFRLMGMTYPIVVEIPSGCPNEACYIVVADPTEVQNPRGVSADGAGDVFIADNLNNLVVEVPVGCTGTSCQATVGIGLDDPLGVAVDAFGDKVYIANTDLFGLAEVALSAPKVVSANVCPAPQTTPTACNQTITLNYNDANAEMFGAAMKFAFTLCGALMVTVVEALVALATLPVQ